MQGTQMSDTPITDDTMSEYLDGDGDIAAVRYKMAKLERELAACRAELERETGRANQWVKSARDLARKLGLPDDESKASTHDWRFIESRLASREGSELDVRIYAERSNARWIPVSGYAEAHARFGGEGIRAYSVEDSLESEPAFIFRKEGDQWYAWPLPPAPLKEPGR